MILLKLAKQIQDLSINSSTQKEIEAFCNSALRELENILKVEKTDLMLIEQTHKLIEIVKKILEESHHSKNSVTQLRMVELANKFSKNVTKQQ